MAKKKKASAKKSETKYPVTVAVHLVSESCDHYTYCVRTNSAEDFVKQIKDNNPDFGWCTTQYLEGLEGANVSELSSALSDAVEAEREAKEAEYSNR